MNIDEDQLVRPDAVRAVVARVTGSVRNCRGHADPHAIRSAHLGKQPRTEVDTRRRVEVPRPVGREGENDSAGSVGTPGQSDGRSRVGRHAVTAIDGSGQGPSGRFAAPIVALQAIASRVMAAAAARPVGWTTRTGTATSHPEACRHREDGYKGEYKNAPSIHLDLPAPGTLLGR
jgi:hypothetical protein